MNEWKYCYFHMSRSYLKKKRIAYSLLILEKLPTFLSLIKSFSHLKSKIKIDMFAELTVSDSQC